MELPERRLLHLVLPARAAQDEALLQSVEQLREAGHRTHLAPIEEPGQGVRLAAEAVRARADVVVAVGGDGTINEVVNGVYQADGLQRCAIAIVPQGTANDFASILGVPQEVTEALRLAVQGRAHAIDVVRCGSQLFVNMASGGFPAEVTAQTPSEVKGVLGGFAYALSGLASAASMRSTPLVVTDASGSWRGEAIAVAVGNGRQAGGGFRVCPQALVDDGLLDVVVIPAVTRGDLLVWVRDLLRLGREIDLEKVRYARVPWVRVEAPQGLQVNFDGEPRDGHQFDFEVMPRAAWFCLPETCEVLEAVAASSAVIAD